MARVLNQTAHAIAISSLQKQIDGLRRDVTHIVVRVQECEAAVRESCVLSASFRRRFRWLLTGR